LHASNRRDFIVTQPVRPSARAQFFPRRAPECTVSVIGPVVGGAILDAWADLAREAEEPNPFFAPWFLQPAIRWLDGAGAVRLLVVRDDGSGALIALMPVVAGATYAGLPARNLSVWKNDHLYIGTPLVRRGHAMAAMRALVGWVGTCEAGLRFLRMTQFPGDGPLHRALTTACAERGRCITVGRRRPRAVLRHGHDFDTLLAAAQSTKRRAELRRRFRRFDEGGGVAIGETVLSPDAAPALAEAFMRLENDGWKGESDTGFALARTEGERAFFRDAIRRGAVEEAVLATVLSRDGEPVAIGFTLRAGTGLFGFKTAFDRGQGRASPGLRIFFETTRRMLEGRGAALYDSCAMPDHPLVDRLWPDRVEGV